MKVTSVQLAFTGLDTAEIGQQSIEGFFKTPNQAQSGTSLKRLREDEDDTLPQMTLPEDVGDDNKATTPTAPSFTCTRCGKSIALVAPVGGGAVPEENRAQALEKLRVEHNDFHFAQDLVKESNAQTPIRSGQPSGTKKKKKREKEQGQGIAKFFAKK